MPLPASFMKKLHESQTKALVLKYFKAPSKPRLIQIMKAAGVPEAELLIKAFESCTRYRPCRLYTCATCGPKIKARAKDAALDRLVCRLGRFPTHEEVSFVTVQGPRVKLDPQSAWDGMRRFEQKLRRFGKRNGKDTSWLGFFDVSAGGLIHWHGIILHPNASKTSLRALLKDSFPEKDQVKISRWKHLQSLAEAMQAVFNYSLVAERHVKTFHRMNGPDYDVGVVYDVEAITRRIIVVQSLAGKGVQGLRFAMNMKPTVRGLKVRELETLRRCTGKARNNKTMLSSPWAPRGTVGTHLTD